MEYRLCTAAAGTEKAVAITPSVYQAITELCKMSRNWPKTVQTSLGMTVQTLGVGCYLMDLIFHNSCSAEEKLVFWDHPVMSLNTSKP
jgi:hypothetical protein